MILIKLLYKKKFSREDIFVNLAQTDISRGFFFFFFFAIIQREFSSCSDKSSKFDSLECTLSAVLYLLVNGGTNFSFIGE